MVAATPLKYGVAVFANIARQIIAEYSPHELPVSREPPLLVKVGGFKFCHLVTKLEI